MLFAQSHIDLHNIRNSIERTKKLSDNVVGIGPFGVGLDGLLTWIPGAGAIYSLGAGSILVFDGVRARAAPMILLQMFAIIAIDTLVGEVPVAGKIADLLFTGHKWSADMLLKHMEDTIYFEGTRKDAANSPEYKDVLSRIRSGKEQRRVVFLG